MEKTTMFYPKDLNIGHPKECFEYLKKHFTYDTMNSWNGLKSIANKVKVYELELEGDAYEALNMLWYNGYDIISEMIREWEFDHKGYKVFFNGRSSGYLVLGNEHNNDNVLPYCITDYASYEQMKCYYQVYSIQADLKFYAKLVRDFDRLCDDIRSYVNELSKCDSVKEMVEEILLNFNEEYSSELSDFNLPDLHLTKDKLIIIPEEMRKHKSLIDCLMGKLLMNKSNPFNVIYTDGVIKIK